MQDAAQFSAFVASDIDRDFRPEMRVAAIDYQPVIVTHGLLNIEGKLQRMDAPAESRVAGLLIEILQHFFHPFSPPLAVEIIPVAAKREIRAVLMRDQGLKKGPGVTQEGEISRPVEINFLVRSVDADKLGCFREQRRVAKIHLVIQARTQHQHQISLMESIGRGVILMHIGKPHIGLAFFAEQFLVIGNVENRDGQLAPCLLQHRLGTGPPDTMPANQHRPPGGADFIQNLLQACGFGPGPGGFLRCQIKWPFLPACILGKG